MIKPGIFFIFILMIHFACAAQVKDSMITYQLLSTDTGAKMPVRKVVNKYSTEHKLAERRIYIWDKFAANWVPQKRYSVNYYAGEIMVDCFNNEFVTQEIQVGRFLFSLDKNQHISECSFLEKERYADKFSRRRKFEFIYRGDTLIQKNLFEQGTTFYKKSVMLIEFDKTKFTVLRDTFAESSAKIGGGRQEFFFAGGQLNKIKYFNQRGDFIIKDTLFYQRDTLHQIHVYNIIPKSTPAELLHHRIIYQISNGYLSSEFLMHYDKNQQAIVNTGNLYYACFPAKKIENPTKLPLRIGLDDFLQ